MIEEKRDYNETHPELEEGEMFLTNCTWDEYIRIGWQTKRKGRKAYSRQGKGLFGLSPVFVHRKEYEEGMKKYE